MEFLVPTQTLIDFNMKIAHMAVVRVPGTNRNSRLEKMPVEGSLLQLPISALKQSLYLILAMNASIQYE